jgi:phenylacetate-CoA ligase
VIEIVNPTTAKPCAPFEEGEVVVTLLNKIYPLIRFGTGDLAMFTDKPCRCGRTTPRLISITGMIGDRIRAKGLFIHGRELDKALSEFSQVLKYQITVSLKEHKDRITLTAEIDQPAAQQALSEAIRKRCKELIRLTLDEIIFVSPNTLPPDFKKFVDQRWK